MAKDNKKGEEPIVDVQQVYSKTEHYVEENKNTLLVIAGILVVLFAGYFAVTRLYLEPLNEEGMELIWKAEYWFENDSLDKALVGDEAYYGFEHVASEYSATQAGALSAYYAGQIYLKKGEYAIAIDYLKNADLDDAMVGSIAQGSIGDAYVQLEDYSAALNYYDKAISHSDNNLTAPIYLKKAGLVCEDQGDFAKALQYYQTIKNDFPKSSEARVIDSYIARVGG